MSKEHPVRGLHPFPARMAPEIALTRLNKLSPGSIVLDPMSGSGTVLRQAMNCGHTAIGYDMDPMAVMMAKAWTSKVDPDQFIQAGQEMLILAEKTSAIRIKLSWIDQDVETKEFINFWFASKQRNSLRKLIWALLKIERKYTPGISNALRVAISRLIITKHKGASLAWDVSHSRPHKVRTRNDFEVFEEFKVSLGFMEKRFRETAFKRSAKIFNGDARQMNRVKSGSVDAVVTSPPYLNAIDYMRGHKLSLVWFGFKISSLRDIRTSSIGTENGRFSFDNSEILMKFSKKATSFDKIPARYQKIILKYSLDAINLMGEIQRVLKSKGSATLVIGDSCLYGQSIRNSEIFSQAAQYHGMKLVERRKRKIPISKRYLPTPGRGSLSKRMKEEVILTFTK